ncbi:MULTISPECIES: hybrid sensor histidine kinase/response regulator [Maribacter]|uniref:hybrid sensor histidine kinase/response regulator n=1 Tax=Maribacter TaxID=252356 RepID=UPI000C08A42F|nr:MULTISPECIES: response regulator [Maribacter]MBU2899467.1 response regulator [Maribacter dokdonensis]MDP2527954.1 ATP-binding protein [Maribacter dokdonensis]PHN93004.1 hybrid sensor histidine kinase/response regulator [Maribacter sp. 6B07]
MKILFLNKVIKVLLVPIIILATTTVVFSQDPISQKDIQPYFDQARKFKNQDKIDLALETLNTAANEAEKREDIKGLIDSLHELALLYLRIDKEGDTEFYWDRASVLLKDISYPYGDGMHKYIEAILLHRSNRNFQSLFMLNEAKQLNNDRNFYNNLLLTEAKVYLSLEKYDSASKNLNSLLVNTDLFEKEYLTSQAYLTLAELNLIQENFSEAAKNGENALEVAKHNGFLEDIKDANILLTSVYEKLGLYQKSLVNSQNLVQLKDSIFNVEKNKIEAKTADKIRDNYKTEEIARQEKKIEELTESQNRSELTAILTSAFLIIISLLAVTLYRNNQIKLKTNDLLQTKNKELQIARDGAVQAMEAKTNFLSTVSHELRTPLYAVTGLTHLLLEENPEEHQKEHLKALKFSGDYLLNFINDILHINKIDANKLEPLNMEFNLKKVINEVINSLGQSAKSNNTNLILEYDPKIPSHLLSDPLKLSQIFMNLIGNSIKFTKGGEVRVISKLLNKDQDDVTIYFEVKDNGIGISKEKQKSIFEGFEQGSIQINREYGGTGLGLTIVKSLLGLFNSQIELESNLGEGSSFFFEIKMKSIDDLAEDVAFEIAPKDYDFKGLHLLIVEDNKINQVITKKMLTKRDMTSDIANNGHEAVDLAKENVYDAILMDIHMPGISGEEATIEIRKFNQDTPIIALTAISLDDSLESFYAAGCNDVVTKPFKPEIFYQKIGENIFDKKPKNSLS